MLLFCLVVGNVSNSNSDSGSDSGSGSDFDAEAEADSEAGDLFRFVGVRSGYLAL